MRGRFPGVGISMSKILAGPRCRGWCTGRGSWLQVQRHGPFRYVVANGQQQGLFHDVAHVAQRSAWAQAGVHADDKIAAYLAVVSTGRLLSRPSSTSSFRRLIPVRLTMTEWPLMPQRSDEGFSFREERPFRPSQCSCWTRATSAFERIARQEARAFCDGRRQKSSFRLVLAG